MHCFHIASDACIAEVSSKRKGAGYCVERGNRDSRPRCLRSCLTSSARGQVDCTFPWLETGANGTSAARRLEYCDSSKGDTCRNLYRRSNKGGAGNIVVFYRSWACTYLCSIKLTESGLQRLSLALQPVESPGDTATASVQTNIVPLYYFIGISQSWNVNDTSHVTDATKALEISDALLDNPQQSECWRRCPDDCSAFEVDAALVGDVRQPRADPRRTVTLILMADLSHSTVMDKRHDGTIIIFGRGYEVLSFRAPSTLWFTF